MSNKIDDERPNAEFGKALTSAAIGLALSCLVAGCETTQTERLPARTMTADEQLAVVSRVVDCEWKAVGRYDDGNYTVSQLAQRVMGVCAVERLKARQAFGLSSNDPKVELDEYKQAIENVEAARKANARIRT
jgi:hypothetical protein